MQFLHKFLFFLFIRRLLLLFNTCHEKTLLLSVQRDFFFSMSHIVKTEVTLPAELLGFVYDLQSLIFAQKEV